MKNLAGSAHARFLKSIGYSPQPPADTEDECRGHHGHGVQVGEGEGIEGRETHSPHLTDVTLMNSRYRRTPWLK